MEVGGLIDKANSSLLIRNLSLNFFFPMQAPNRVGLEVAWPLALMQEIAGQFPNLVRRTD